MRCFSVGLAIAAGRCTGYPPAPSSTLQRLPGPTATYPHLPPPTVTYRVASGGRGGLGRARLERWKIGMMGCSDFRLHLVSSRQVGRQVDDGPRTVAKSRRLEF